MGERDGGELIRRGGGTSYQIKWFSRTGPFPRGSVAAAPAFLAALLGVVAICACVIFGDPHSAKRKTDGGTGGRPEVQRLEYRKPGLRGKGLPRLRDGSWVGRPGRERTLG